MSNKYSLTLVGTLPVVQWRIQRADKIDLGFMQKEVGGFIEQIHLYHELEKKKIVTFVNEEGKYLNLPPLFNIINEKGIILDTVVGNVLFLKEKGEDLIGLSAKEVKEIIERPDLDKIGYISLAEGCSKDFGSWFPKGKRVIDVELLGSDAGKIVYKAKEVC